MPHSSGGGSHGGGSHGSSSSHGGHHSSAPARHVRSVPFRGSRTFYTYVDKRPVYRYADYDIVSDAENSKVNVPTLVIVLCIFGFLLLSSIRGAFYIPQKLNVDTKQDIGVVDNLDILDGSEEAKIQESLEKLYEETGVATVVLLDKNESWQDYYSSLENYAYEKYCQLYDDEYHWVIVYTQPEDPESEFVDWYWEGIIGDDTSDALNQTHIDEFNEELQRALYRNPNDLAEAFSKSINYLCELSSKISFDLVTFLYSTIFILIMGLIFLNGCLFAPLKRKKYASYQEIRTSDKPIEVRCDYCGGIYIAGTCISCPHCAAPVKTLEEARTMQNKQ